MAKNNTTNIILEIAVHAISRTVNRPTSKLGAFKE